MAAQGYSKWLGVGVGVGAGGGGGGGEGGTCVVAKTWLSHKDEKLSSWVLF